MLFGSSDDGRSCDALGMQQGNGEHRHNDTGEPNEWNDEETN